MPPWGSMSSQVVITGRRVRAGSVTPTKSDAGGFVTTEDKKDWERWQARESKAQASLKGTVSQAVRLGFELPAAVNMWRHCVKTHEVDLPESQRLVQSRLWTMDVRDDASADDLSAHVETFKASANWEARRRALLRRVT